MDRRPSTLCRGSREPASERPWPQTLRLSRRPDELMICLPVSPVLQAAPWGRRACTDGGTHGRAVTVPSGICGPTSPLETAASGGRERLVPRGPASPGPAVLRPAGMGHHGRPAWDLPLRPPAHPPEPRPAGTLHQSGRLADARGADGAAPSGASSCPAAEAGPREGHLRPLSG